MNKLLSSQGYELFSDSLPARDLAYSLARIYIGMAMNMYMVIDQARSQDGWILTELFSCMFIDGFEVHNHAKKERGHYPAILSEQAWSRKDLLYYYDGIKNTRKWSFGKNCLAIYKAGIPELVMSRSAILPLSWPITKQVLVYSSHSQS